MKNLIFLYVFLFINLPVIVSQSLSYSLLTNGLSTPAFKSGKTDFCLDDVNMDGHVDILTVGDHGSPSSSTGMRGISVWFGDGNGNFQFFANGDFGYGSVVVGDVNNDGHKDVGYGIHHDYSSTDFGDQILEVALGDGSGQSWTAWDDGLATNGETWGMSGIDFGDVNNDGLLDLVSISFGAGAGMHVYLNQGDGTWEHSFGFLNGNAGNQVQFADFNNDGYLDFASTHAFGTAYFGDGTGHFVNKEVGLPSHGTNQVYADIATGDVNNDGAAELIIVTQSGSVKIYTWSEDNDQWIDFSGNLPIGGGYHLAELKDMNNDGFNDLVAVRKFDTHVFLGDGSSQWTIETSITFPEMGTPIALRTGGDFDNNGHFDFLVLSEVGTNVSHKNKMFCYKENTLADSLWIKSHYPHGGEIFHPFSSRFITWTSAVPAYQNSLVDIEYAIVGLDGPWLPAAQDIPNNGKHQWNIPDVPSNEVYLRLIVKTEESADTSLSRPFTIFGLPNSVAQNQQLKQPIVYPNPGFNYIFLDEGLEIRELRIFDNKGNQLKAIHQPSGRINTAQLPAGLYFLQIIFNDGSLRNEKWLKTKN
ncbi:MAG: T9SS type A sorting domain-containing protein [Bacteroidales bacterium]|jgi:hypothetical protein|nr:T9SS type A sorting domain-containing protein [Bacteroidales bacterium]